MDVTMHRPTIPQKPDRKNRSKRKPPTTPVTPPQVVRVGDWPLLLDVKLAAAYLGFSTRTIWSMSTKGQLPAPIKVPGLRSTRWRRADLERTVEEWTAAKDRN